MCRQQLDLYACIRPVRHFEGVVTPVQKPGDMDVVIFRENTEDVYAGIEWEQGTDEAKKVINENKKKLEKDIENKKQKFDEEIEKELEKTEKEIKNLKKTSVSSINKIAVEIASETIKQIIGTEVNKSNVTAIVDDLSKKKMEKFL